MGTLRLTLLRHGHAEPIDAAPEDYVRQLTVRGRSEATAMGERLARAGRIPELILVSSAARTRTTAQLAAAALGLPATHIAPLDGLYNAEAPRIWELVRSEAGKAQHVLVCGHNPGLSRLASELAAGSGTLPRRIDLPPAGLVSAVWPAHRAGWPDLALADARDAELILP